MTKKEPRRTGAPEKDIQRQGSQHDEKVTSCRNLTCFSQASLHLANEPAFYIYTDRLGNPLFRVVRQPGKQFRQEAWDAVGERWLPRLLGVRRVLYQLPEVIAGVKAGRTISVVEGEKDVEALRALGKVATCNPGGAGKFLPEFAQYFAGAKVRIIQDRDPAGHTHALQVEKLLKPVAAKVRILEVQIGNDVSDHLEAGLSLAFRPARRYAHEDTPKPPPRPHPDPGNHPEGDQRGIQLVLSRLSDAVDEGRGQWSARCPAHDDRVRSLSIAVGTYRPVVLYCHAGCDSSDVLSAIGLAFGRVM